MTEFSNNPGCMQTEIICDAVECQMQMNQILTWINERTNTSIGNSPYFAGLDALFWVDPQWRRGCPPDRVANVKENMVKVLKWAVVLLMGVLGQMAGASALASAAPDTQGDVTYLQLLDQNGVSYPNPEAIVSFAHDLVDELIASPQNDASVGSIVKAAEERISQHDMGVIIAAAVVAYRPSLIPVVRHWADSAAGFPCGSAAEGVLR